LSTRGFEVDRNREEGLCFAKFERFCPPTNDRRKDAFIEAAGLMNPREIALLSQGEARSVVVVVGSA
jgi:hypothetical protein